MYRSLSDEQKIKYISQAVCEVTNQSSNAIGSLSFLTKDELRILHGSSPVPKKINAYNVFVKEFCQNHDGTFLEAPSAYRKLTPAGKLKYQEMADKLNADEKKEKKETKLSLSLGLDQTDIKTEKTDKDISLVMKSESKKRKSQPNESWADDSFKSPTKPAPHALDTSIKSNGTPSKKRKTLSETDIGLVRKIKVEKERPVEPDRVPT